jgi:predicted nucleotidyltransferase
MIASLISTAKSFATLSRSFSPHVLQQSKFGCRPRFLKTPGFRAGGGRFPRLSSRASTGNDHVLHKIEKLKLTSATTFRRPEFQNVLWAGVCGSFSRGTETHFSDVDIIVIEEPRLRSEPPSFIYLDDCLLRVWARKVDAHFISLGDSNPYKSLAYSKMHDLIESRTIYIRDQEACSEIARFRNISIEKTAEAHAHYSEITKRIDHLGEKYAAVSIDVSSWNAPSPSIKR